MQLGTLSRSLLYIRHVSESQQRMSLNRRTEEELEEILEEEKKWEERKNEGDIILLFTQLLEGLLFPFLDV